MYAHYRKTQYYHKNCRWTFFVIIFGKFFLQFFFSKNLSNISNEFSYQKFCLKRYLKKHSSTFSLHFHILSLPPKSSNPSCSNLHPPNTPGWFLGLFSWFLIQFSSISIFQFEILFVFIYIFSFQTIGFRTFNFFSFLF